ncbi:hypothetical protein CDL15_Pgr014637 [Punica granatum]|uniref:Protein MIS12 homolog n=1 Tax=Punica granatum TaxID=22663 RepID=A0A218XYZ9_PUNGR|nr:hypothetical protein CDL15_Pgr014637 [Punica granatum]
MEGGGESEATFESLKLNPQIFINEVLNSVDDLLDEALRYYHQQASASLKTGGTDRDQDLSKGVDTMRNMVQSVLDSHLGMWEKYCLRHCFKVPEGFSLTKPVGGGGFGVGWGRFKRSLRNSDLEMKDELPDGDSFMDTEPDTQLETLRNKLYQATKESAELSQELQALERQSVSSDHSRKIVNEVLQSCEQSSANEMIQEIMRSADELRLKIGTLKNQRTEEKGFQRIKDLKIDYLNKDVSLTERVKGYLFSLFQVHTSAAKRLLVQMLKSSPLAFLLMLPGCPSTWATSSVVLAFGAFEPETLNRAGDNLWKEEEAAVPAHRHSIRSCRSSQQNSQFSGSGAIA